MVRTFIVRGAAATLIAVTALAWAAAAAAQARAVLHVSPRATTAIPAALVARSAA